MDERYFTQEHEVFRQTVRKFVEKELTPYAEEWEEKEEFPREVFKKLGEQGYLGIRYPAEYGGSELDFWYTVVFVEELARCGSGGVAMSVMVQSDMASPPINILGTPQQKKKFLEPVIKGDKIIALGVTEPGAGSDVASLKTTAVKQNGEYVINGTKMFITNGCRADLITLAARTDTNSKGHRGISVIMVETDRPGFSIGKKLKKLGQKTSDTAELVFDNVRVPAENLLGQEGTGFYEVMKNFQGERLVAAISAVAGAQLVWEKTFKYCQEREQFGRPIAKFQVNRHKLVDMLTEIEAARQLTYYAAYLYNQKKDCVKEVSMAKLFASELANRVAYHCLQLHGGYGYMKEYNIERYFRDVRLITIGGGTSEVMKEIIGRFCLGI